jgi:glycosyltransferase involved in cell wall biosynthesis
VQKRFPDWRLMIAGPDNGGYLSKMQQLASQLHLERIEFVGGLRGRQKWEAYQDADLFVLPTYSENFGMTVAEALAAGVPAIVSRGAPWPDLEGKKAGWWIDIGVDPLVACLNETLSLKSAALTEMGERGRSWMEAEFSWKRIAGQMSETYHWILLGGNKPEWIIQN